MKTVLIKIFPTVCFVSATYLLCSSAAAAFAALVCALLVWYAAGAWQNIVRQRAEWKAAPVPPEISKFDAFFWKQLISQQEWYLENIYTTDDIKSLIAQYTDKIRSVWSDNSLLLQKRMETVKMYMARINSLSYYLEYTEPQRSLLD